MREEGRLNVEIACMLVVGEQVLAAEIVNLSPRGAQVRAAEVLPAVGANIALRLADQDVPAEVRFSTVVDGKYRAGLALRPEAKTQRAVLRRVLFEHLHEKGSGGRRHPRLVARWPARIT